MIFKMKLDFNDLEYGVKFLTVLKMMLDSDDFGTYAGFLTIGFWWLWDCWILMFLKMALDFDDFENDAGYWKSFKMLLDFDGVETGGF